MLRDYRCRECNAPVVDWAKHRAWHQGGVVCDCGDNIGAHPINWNYWQVGDPCALCPCPMWMPRLAEPVALRLERVA